MQYQFWHIGLNRKESRSSVAFTAEHTKLEFLVGRRSSSLRGSK